MTLETAISKVEASAYTVPTSSPEADGTFAWTDTTLVLVQIWAAGQVRIGWTYASTAAATLVRATLAPLLIGRRVTDIPGLWNQMLISLRNIGRPGIGAMALSAVDCALWDLKARVLELPLWQLLGPLGTRCRSTSRAASPAMTATSYGPSSANGSTTSSCPGSRSRSASLADRRRPATRSGPPRPGETGPQALRHTAERGARGRARRFTQRSRTRWRRGDMAPHTDVAPLRDVLDRAGQPLRSLPSRRRALPGTGRSADRR